MKRALAVSALLVLSGCGLMRGCTSSKPPIHINPSMDNQPKLRAQQESKFFYDGSGMRKPVEGTVARGELHDSDGEYLGKNEDGSFVAANPFFVDNVLLARGKARYAIYCQPCHDPHGDGKGILFTRGNVPTASFHQDKIRNYPDGQIYDVITNGSGLMPSYKWPIPPHDRWAIVAYVRQLQKERVESIARRATP
ncbi:MAG TPA: cytochrome c [Candidatus Polarisedimenticolaceae bacterium]|nr:cytochrome c [Candidatus Polarisedimenticolaceae bacterium]